jgi:uncharacterized protein YhjY with autotransporter beta-barrel domain
VSEQRDFKDQQFAPDLTEREWLDRHREVTRHGLARAMQAYALGSMYEMPKGNPNETSAMRV